MSGISLFLFAAVTFGLSSAWGDVSWRHDFDGSSLDSSFWVPSTGGAPGNITNNHTGFFSAEHLSVANGYLTILLTQEKGPVGTNAKGVISRGGEIESANRYGYGVYEWRMRASSTSPTPSGTGTSVSGTISAGFNYFTRSQTEIDFEIEGQFPTVLHMTSWMNPNPLEEPLWPDHMSSRSTAVSGMETGFHTYKFVWAPGKIEFFVDDQWKNSTTTHVPSEAAYFMINHWGTNSADFGGLATVGAKRYLHVDWVQYTAPTDAPVPVPSASPSVAPPLPPADLLPPRLVITSPRVNSLLAARQKIQATASDNVGVTKVVFYIDQRIIATDTVAPYLTTLNTRSLARGAHEIRAVAFDAAGNRSEVKLAVKK